MKCSWKIEKMTAVFCLLMPLLVGGLWPTPAMAQDNLLSNRSFEAGVVNIGWGTNIVGWYSANNTHGRLIANAADAHSGTNYARAHAWGGTPRYLRQYWPATESNVYKSAGWLRTEEGSYAFRPSNAYAAVVMQFYDSSDSVLGGNVESFHFGANGPTNWTQYETGPALAPAGTVSGLTLFVYYGLGEAGPADTTTNGYIRVDDMSVTNASPTTSGALRNPDFEVQPRGTLLTIPYWTGYGDEVNGSMNTNNPRSGRFNLSIGYTETFLGQSWAATSGVRYMVEGYMSTPSSDPLSSTNAFAFVMLQCLNATGGVVAAFEGEHLTRSSDSDRWILSHAEGIAPAGTVTCRVMCGITGVDAAYSGRVDFDDFTQVSSAATATTCGVLSNPGFDDGASGNAYELDQVGMLMGWTWFGGTNAGFIQQSVKYEGPQALSITYPNNLMVQGVPATTGSTYVFQGYLNAPSLQGEAYGSLLLQFYKGTDLVSTVESSHFTTNSPTNSWVYFSVTNRAPWSGAAVTAKVSAAILGSTSNFGGAIYYDSFCLTSNSIPLTNTAAGLIANPGFEYTANGTVLKHIDNWQNFGFDGAVAASYTHSGQNALRIFYTETLAGQSWNATGGVKYGCSAYASTPAAEKLAGNSNLQALVVMEFLDATNGVLASYASNPFRTNATAGTWSNLTAKGWAPAGTVRARTSVGIVGSGSNYTGAVYFDDANQWIESSGSSSCGLIGNPGFDDGMPGNIYDLDITTNLPSWSWLGGTNAGFIQTSYKLDGDQALAITYPNNLAVQGFAATTGMSYIVSGSIYNPASERLTDQLGYGVLLLQFFNDGTNLVSTKETLHFTTNSAADTWISFSVTNRAPSTGNITGRIAMAYFSATNTGGALYFDTA
ncbi:MAG: hypothetical protein V2A34_01345, partial [Lentisphaerota bacterium]